MYHTMTICEEVADRMRDPRVVQEIMIEQYRRIQFPAFGWARETLIEGFPGIACFYGMMDRVFPNEGWDAVTHDYLTVTRNILEETGFDNISLFSGLTGICFALTFCSFRGERYQNILQTLEDILIDQIVDTYIKQGKKYVETNASLPVTYYNLSDGISGILGYALLKKDSNHRLFQTVMEATGIFLQLFSRSFDKGSYFPWYLSPEHQLTESEEEKYSQGSYLINMPFGVTGCLAALSFLALDGTDLLELNAVIKTLAYWLKGCGQCKGDTHYFGNTIPIEGEAIDEISRDTWWYGIPAVAPTLFKAGKAIRDKELQLWAEELAVSMFLKDRKEWNPMGTSFVNGRAGILASTYRMAEATENPKLWQHVKELEADLSSFYRPESFFGLQMVHVDTSNRYHWVDNPGLLYGASGIALSLMLVQNREVLDWDRAFLLH